MPRLPRLLALLLIAPLLTGLLVACGDDGDEKEPTATAPAAEETATEAPPTTPEATEPEPTDTSAGLIPFDSVHYVVDLEITIAQPGEAEETFISGQVEGDYVAPDSHAFTNTFEFGGLSGTEEIVIIGDDAWIREGQGDWTATSRLASEIADTIDLTSADPGFLSATDLAEGISALDSEAESINGVQTRRYHIPREAIETLSEILGEDFLADTAGLEDFEMTVWLDEETDGLVRAELTATASPDIFGDDAGFNLAENATVTISMTIDVTQINDPDIEIEPPV